jgi:hypothetical protein
MVYGLQINPDLGFMKAWMQTEPTARRAPTGSFKPDVGAEVAQAALPGTYFASYGFLDGATVKVAAGALSTLDLSANTRRRVTRIIAAPAELPDAACPDGKRVIKFTGPGRDGVRKTRSASLDAPFEIGQNEDVVLELSSFNFSREITYSLSCLSTSLLPMTLPLGELGGAPLQLKLGRIDVDDISVTQNDGSVKAVRGKYQVYDANNNGRPMLATALDTNTGVDLPRGTYDVVATYPKTDGTSGTWRSRFTTP